MGIGGWGCSLAFCWGHVGLREGMQDLGCRVLGFRVSGFRLWDCSQNEGLLGFWDPQDLRGFLFKWSTYGILVSIGIYKGYLKRVQDL